MYGLICKFQHLSILPDHFHLSSPTNSKQIINQPLSSVTTTRFYTAGQLSEQANRPVVIYKFQRRSQRLIQQTLARLDRTVKVTCPTLADAVHTITNYAYARRQQETQDNWG